MLSDREQRVADVAAGMRDEIAQALSAFAKIPSVNPKYPGVEYEEHIGGETEANRYLSGLYEAAGCEVRWVERETGRGNLVGVVPGGGGGRSLVLNGHVDVVPPGEASAWSLSPDPFSGAIIDGLVIGRGVADMKGGLISAVMATSALRRSGVGLRGDLLLQSVVGEETGDHDIGVRAVLQQGFTADAGIVCEPTGHRERFTVAAASGGLLWMTLRVRGKAGHNNLRGDLVHAGGLGEEAGVNAVEKGVFLLTMLQELERQWGQSKSHPLFKPGWFSLHPGVIVGAPQGILVPFMISQYCNIEYSILYPPNESADAIKAEIEGFVQDAAQLDPWLRKNPPEIEWRLHWPPFITDIEQPIVPTVVGAHQDVAGVLPEDDPRRVGGFAAVCDATFLRESDVESVAYGPGTILQAHREDESIAIEELVLAAQTYALTAMRWCGVGG
jgi:acetylornithine deacetylase/succinyl-diaminopimelate desuccinylase family protein